MFDQLPESAPRRRRSARSTVVSAALHLTVIAAAVSATARADRITDYHVDRPTSIYVQAPPDITPRPQGGRDSGARAAPPDRTAAPRFAPVCDCVPTQLPPIDAPLTGVADPDAALRDALSIGDSLAARRGGPPAGEGGAIVAAYADKPAIPVAGNAEPRYPEALRVAGVAGAARLQFVIDSTGGVDMTTVRVLSADHPLFADAARAALARWRFLPAAVRDRPVRVLVEQSFVFNIR